MKTKQNVWFLLPTQLKEDINRIQFRIPSHKNKALKFIRHILKQNQKDNFDSLKFRQFPASYLKKIFKGDYKNEFLDLLIDNQIIEVNGAYSVKNHVSKSFRIHESYFSGSMEYSSTSYSDSSYLSNISIPITTVYSPYLFTPYMLPDFKRLSLEHCRIDFTLSRKAQNLGVSAYPYLKKSLLLPESSTNSVTYISELSKESITDSFDFLSIDFNRILKKTNEVVSAISYNSFKIGSEVEGSYFEVYNRISATSQWMTKVGASVAAQKFGATLIQDKDKYYIDDLDRYIETKKRNILVSYNTSVTALRKRIYSVNRNWTNYRLDSVFTSMCAQTLEVIKEDNSLVEIDLVNSQYAIFANWLMSDECYREADVRFFCRLAINGGLYEFIMEKLGLESRKQAKKIMMVVAFSSHRFNSTQKNQFKELFPNVYQFISNFNKKSDGRFAVWLQNKESRIFIDGLLNILVAKGYFVITKHDSLIIKEDDREAIIDIVNTYFQLINFKAAVKCGDETYQNGVPDTQILDETEKEYECQGEGNGEEIGYLKQQLPRDINVDKITPYDNTRNQYGHIEPFLYHGCTVQTRKYYQESFKLDEESTEEFYREQFKQIESMAA